MRKYAAALGLSLAILVAVLFLLMRSGQHDSRGEGFVTDGTGAGSQGPVAEQAVGDTASEDAGKGAAAPGESQLVLYGRVTNEEDRGIPAAEVSVVVASAVGGFGGGMELFGRGRGGDGLRGGDGMEVLRDRILGKAPLSRMYARVTEVKTDGDGKYAIPLAAIPQGDFLVLARHDDYASAGKQWTRTQESSELNFILGPGEWIEGIVRAQRGVPIADARVQAFVMRDFRGGPMGGGDELVDQTQSGADGRFRLTVPTGTYRVSAAARGYLEEAARDIASGTKDLELVLPPSAAVIVTVSDAQSKPLAGVQVSLYVGDTFGGRGGPGGRGGRGGPGGQGGNVDRFVRLMRPAQDRAETGSDGKCRFVDVPQESFSVYAEKAGFVSAGKSGRIEGASAALEVAVALDAGAMLAGIVLDPKGAPVAGAFVAAGEYDAEDAQRRQEFERMRGARGGPGATQGEANAAPVTPPETTARAPEPVALFEASAAVETDKRGRFAFDTLRAGHYSVSVQARDFVPYRADDIEASLPAPQDLTIKLETGSTLKGKVVARGGGQPVAGAVVQVSTSRMETRRAVTDVDGNFSMRGFYPGPLDNLQIRAKGFTVAVIDRVTIAPGEDTHEEVFELTPSASISGTVKSRTGEPVRNARLVASPVRDEEQQNGGPGGMMRFGGFMRDAAQSAQVRSDAAGAFHFTDVTTERPLQILVSHADYVAFRSEPFSLNAGEQREGLEYVLSEGAKLRVLVRATDGTPVPQAAVSLRRVIEDPAAGDNQGGPGGRGQRGGGPGGRGGTTRMTGADGRTRFTGLEAGTYAAVCAIDTFQPYSKNVTLAEEQEGALDINLLPENAITGIVSDKNNVAIEGADVSAFGGQGGGGPFMGGSRATSDANGFFRLGNLGEGPYTVRARTQGFAEATLADTKVNVDIAIVLQRLGGIQGVVMAARTGAPVTSFRVRLRTVSADGTEAGGGRGRGGAGGGGPFGGGGPAFFPREVSSPDGVFTIDEVAPGTYLVEVTAEGFSGRQVSVKVREGEVEDRVVVTLEDGLSVAGYVSSKRKGAALPEADVYVMAVPRSERVRGRAQDAADAAAESPNVSQRLDKPVTKTDETGGFSLKELPPGTYKVIVHHPDYLPAVSTVEIRDDGVAKEVRVSLEDGESLQGAVKAGNDGLAAAAVQIQDAQGLTKVVYADEHGKYEVRGLAPGTYSYSVRVTADQTPQTGRVTIRRGSNRFDIKVR